jgi:predicted nuclease of predicted toxin-antitoxin system
VKFLVDMPLSPALAAWLRDESHDAVHAAELGLQSAPDIDVLTLAKREGRTTITADLDYPRLMALARTSQPSLILFRDGTWSEADVIARIADPFQVFTAADIQENIIVVERGRVRRRRLPIDR